jgi:hypothetical protein
MVLIFDIRERAQRPTACEGVDYAQARSPRFVADFDAFLGWQHRYNAREIPLRQWQKVQTASDADVGNDGCIMHEAQDVLASGRVQSFGCTAQLPD